MKYLTTVILVVFLFACSNQNEILPGTWTVQDEFISATYQIEKTGSGFAGLVLSYNDGTTRYQRQRDERHYVFTGLKGKEDIFVDGMSGATPKKDQLPHLTIQPIHKDTLAVTTYVMGHPLVETWIQK